MIKQLLANEQLGGDSNEGEEKEEEFTEENDDEEADVDDQELDYDELQRHSNAKKTRRKHNKQDGADEEEEEEEGEEEREEDLYDFPYDEDEFDDANESIHNKILRELDLPIKIISKAPNLSNWTDWFLRGSTVPILHAISFCFVGRFIHTRHSDLFWPSTGHFHPFLDKKPDRMVVLKFHSHVIRRHMKWFVR